MYDTQKKNLRTTLLCGAASIAVAIPMALAPSLAVAQDQASGEEADQIIVTGSRIARAGFDTLQPAIEVDSDYLEARSFTSVADALNDAPAFGDPIAGANVGGQSGQTIGSAFVNAFGLGTQRTLTLINGRRVVGQNRVTTGFAGAGGAGAGAALGLQVDLNIVPTALIERVETIFIGGSPAYGSDAVAGTVNVILKDDFEGLETDVQFGRASGGRGETFRISSLLGGNFAGGRGNVVMGADYINQEEILGSDSVFQTRQLVNNPDDTGTSDGIPDNILIEDTENIWGLPNTGAPVPTPGFWTSPIGGANGFTDTEGNSLFFNLGGTGFTTYEEQVNALGPNVDNVFFAAGGDCRNSDFCTSLTEVNTVQQGTDRWTFNSVGHYDVTDSIRYVFEGLYARTETRTPTQPRWSTFTFNPVSLLQIRLEDPFGRVDPARDERNPFVTQGMQDVFVPQLPDTFTDANGNGVTDLSCVLDASVPDDELVDVRGDDGSTAAANTLPECAGDSQADLNLDTDGDGIPDTLGFFLTRSNIDLVGLDRDERNQNVFRFVQGLEGELEFADRLWNWDVSYVYGQTSTTTQQQTVNDDRFSLALDAVRDPVTGAIVCRASLDENGDGQPDVLDNPQSFSFQDPKNLNDGFNDAADCVPFNPIGFNPDQVAAQSYILGQNIQESKIEQMVIEGNIVGELFDLPAGPVDFAGGFTHRREKAQFDVDVNTQQANDGGDPTLPVDGDYNTIEVYGETLIPIFGDANRPLPFLAGMQAEAAARFVDNNVAGQDITWTAGGRLHLDLPLIGEGLTVRGNYTQSVRAPSIVELFAPLQAQNIFANDPCDPRFIDQGPNPAVRRANCEAQVAQLQSSGALPGGFDLANFFSLITNSSQRSFTGGNTQLENEVADSWTVGGVLTPEFFPGDLTISIDWTRIALNDAIINISGNQLLASCYDTPGLTADACSAFTRGGATGFEVIDPTTGFVNAALRDFAGLVANVDWDVPLDTVPFMDGGLPGDLNIAGQFFHTHRNEQSTTDDDLDIFASEGGFEKFRFNLNANYELENLSLFWQVRYIGGGNVRTQSSPEVFEFPTFQSTNLHNFAARYQITDNIGARFTVQNVFNTLDSPRLQAGLTDDSGNNGRFRDVIGRRLIFGLNGSF